MRTILLATAALTAGERPTYAALVQRAFASLHVAVPSPAIRSVVGEVHHHRVVEPLRHAAQASLAHQTGHPVTSTPLTGVAQILPDSRAPDDAIGISMELTNPGQKPGVLLGSRTRHPRRPAVIPTG